MENENYLKHIKGPSAPIYDFIFYCNKENKIIISLSERINELLVFESLDEFINNKKIKKFLKRNYASLEDFELIKKDLTVIYEKNQLNKNLKKIKKEKEPKSFKV